MASYSVTDEMNRLAEIGIPAAEVIAAIGQHVLVETGEGWWINSRREQARFDAYYERAIRKAAPRAAAPLATERQVDFIMSLLAQGRGSEGGFFSGPTTREGVAKMTRTAASDYISSLKGSY